MFTIFAGIYYWFPKMTGRMYDERLGKLHFWMTFIGFNVTFGPMHWLGLEGMPRRVADYADKFAAWNLVSSIGAFLLGAAMLVFLYNFIASWVGRAARARQPVARAHARVAGLLAAADLQLRRDPAGRRRPVRVRRARLGARGPERRPREGRGRCRRRAATAHAAHGERQRPRDVPANGAQSGVTWRLPVRQPAQEPAHVLVVSNETVGGQKLHRRDRAPRGARPDPLHRRVPAEHAAARLRDLRRHGALGRARAAGADLAAAARDGHRGARRGDGPGPLPRDCRTRCASGEPTRSSSRPIPYPRSGVLRRDLVERIEKWSGLPVEHVIVDLREEPVRNVLVVASQTVGGPEPDRDARAPVDVVAAPLHRDPAADRPG